MEELHDVPQSYKLGYELLTPERRSFGFCRRNHKTIGFVAVSLLIISNFLFSLLSLILVGYGVGMIHNYEPVAHRAESVEDTVAGFMKNITSLRNDISIYADLATILIKHKKEIDSFFSFMNDTQTFITEAKGCINKYGVCPHMK